METYTLGLSDSDDESDGDSFDWLAGQVRVSARKGGPVSFFHALLSLVT